MKNKRNNEQGMALLLATIFVTIAVFVLGAVMVGVVSESRQVENFEHYELCMHGVESAIAMSMDSIERGEGGLVGIATGSSFDPLAADPFDEPGVSPLTMPGMPDLEFMAYVVDWMNDGVDNNGDGTVDGLSELGFYTIYAYARWSNQVRRVEVVAAAKDVNVWRNAIFAGAGQSGGLINGNVAIHGSVHLLGDNVLTGGQALTAIDLGGTSLIHNNYGGCPADLVARVPPLPTTTFNGETVSTLDAELRVRRGLVGLSGNSEIGAPDIPGSGVKETLDATYVTDGWTGNSTVDDGGRGVPTQVSSDNGWDETYDLGERVPMPLLQEDWRDPQGNKVWDDGRNLWYTHENYFREVLVGEPGVYHGDININVRNDDFYYNATRPLDTDPENRLSTDNYMLFNKDTNVLEINGQMYVDGNLSFTGQGNQQTMHYTGRGAILVNGNATLSVDILSRNSNGTTALSFPAANCFGLMAAGNLLVGGNSQQQMMGAFYGQNTVSSDKQTTTMGSFVGNFFNMGSNVPKIYQVPTLADNLPYGMIGNFPIVSLDLVSWRELGI